MKRLAIALLLLASPVAADHRGAHWTPPGDPDLATYRVYVCTRRPNEVMPTVCTKATASLHATVVAPASRGPLPNGEGLFFVTALDFSGNESVEPPAVPFDFLAPSPPSDLRVL